MMCMPFLCCVLTIAPPPSCDSILKAIVADREKIQTLHVRATTTDLIRGGEVGLVLYLDVTAGRWREDFTRIKNPSGLPDSIGPAGFTKSESFSVEDDAVYQFLPHNPRAVAKKMSLKSVAKMNLVRPFADPRNVGLVPRVFSRTRMPFESGGARLGIWTDWIDFTAQKEVLATATKWNEKASWSVEAAAETPPDDRCIINYVVVPEWDHSVVFF